MVDGGVHEPYLSISSAYLKGLGPRPTSVLFATHPLKRPTVIIMIDKISEPKAVIDEPVWGYEPFDRSLIRLPKRELNCAFHYIAVHGTPTDYISAKGLTLMRWELVCVCCDMYDGSPMRTMTFTVKGRPTRKWFEPYICVRTDPCSFEDTKDLENFWWRWALPERILGNTTSFQKIVDLLEKEQNRYEKLYVSGETLEGTYLWVRAIVELLEEKGIVQDHNPAPYGDSIVAADLTHKVMGWMEKHDKEYYHL